MVERADNTNRTAQVGWHPDPNGRYDLRYFNGRSWTADVSVDGQRFVDPAGTRPGPTTAPAEPTAATTPWASMTPTPVEARNPIATASMVLGIVAVGIGWMPFVVALGAIAAVLAIVLGVTGRRRARSSGVGAGFATIGLITGAAALLVCVGGVLFSVSLLRAMDRYDQPADNETVITSCERTGDDLVATGMLTNTSTAIADYTVRVHFVRPGTDNPRRQTTVVLDDVAAGGTVPFDATVNVGDLDLDCTIGSVRGPFPYGVDPGG